MRRGFDHRNAQATLILGLLSISTTLWQGTCAAGADDEAPASIQHVLPGGGPGPVRETPPAQSQHDAVFIHKDYVIEKSPLEALIPYTGLDATPQLADASAPPGDELTERRVIGEMARHGLVPDGVMLDQFESTLTRYLKTDARTASGVPKLNIVYERFNAENSDEFRQRFVIEYVLDAVTVWEQRHTASVFAPVFKALMLKNIALAGSIDNGRGSGAVFENFDRDAYLARAKAALDTAPQAAIANPIWYETMIKIRAMQSATTHEIFALAKEGASKFSGSVGIFTSSTTGVMNASQFPARDIELLAIAAGEYAPEGERNAAYTRVYLSVLLGHGPQSFQLLKMSPERFAAGVRELTEKHKIEFMYQRLALMSCVVADKSTSQALWSRIRGRPIQSIWGNPEFFEICRAWTAENDTQDKPREDPFELQEMPQREIEN